MQLFTQIAQLILCLSILIVLHEGGHFLAAKYFKTRVEKFYLFFDPWFSIVKKKIGETEYGIGWLPLGGYVKITGMIDESMDTEQMKGEAQPWEFRAKPAWQRLIIMLAGIIVNVILAIVIYAGVLFVWGEVKIDSAKVIDGYAFSKPAQAMGFRNGDNIIAINGEPVTDVNKLPMKILLGDSATVVRDGKKLSFPIADAGKEELMNQKEREIEPLVAPRSLAIADSIFPQGTASKVLQKGDVIASINNQPIQYQDEMNAVFNQSKKDTVNIGIVRNGKEISAKLYIPDSAIIGISNSHHSNIKKAVYIQNYNLLQAVGAAPRTAWNALTDQVGTFKLIKIGVLKQVSGPLRLYKVFSPTWDGERFWNFTAMFSIWLAFLNLLPIPGLDGGHALFCIGEMITGRKLSDKIMEKIQMVGIVILLALMVLIFGNDIWHIIENAMHK
ncbi:MAG: RIP metalloprotease RseP [Flavobacteriaceae bacterium]|jgi:regulator of sigma E protease|nr:RIP metalloprotease RseP [Flavobacteriaceae bacterium]